MTIVLVPAVIGFAIVDAVIVRVTAGSVLVVHTVTVLVGVGAVIVLPVIPIHLQALEY